MAPERDKTADGILWIKSPENPFQGSKKPKNRFFASFHKGCRQSMY
jgi:hypothetical protein